MNRRGFVGALTGAVAAIAGGASWLATRGGKADLSPAPSALDPLKQLEDSINRALGPIHDVKLRLSRMEDAEALIGDVASLRSRHNIRFRCSLWKERALRPDQQARMVYRQVRYQTKKAAEAIVRERGS